MLNTNQLELIEKALDTESYQDLAEALQSCDVIAPPKLMYLDRKSKEQLKKDLITLWDADGLLTGAGLLETVPESTLDKANHLVKHTDVFETLHFWQYLLVDTKRFCVRTGCNIWQKALVEVRLQQAIRYFDKLGLSIKWEYVYWNRTQYQAWDMFLNEVSPDTPHDHRLESLGAYYFRRQAS